MPLEAMLLVLHMLATREKPNAVAQPLPPPPKRLYAAGLVGVAHPLPLEAVGLVLEAMVVAALHMWSRREKPNAVAQPLPQPPKRL